MAGKLEKAPDKLQIAAPRLLGSCRLNIALMGLAAYFCSILMTLNLGMAIVCINKRLLTCANGTSEFNCTASPNGPHENGTSFSEEEFTQEDQVHLDKPSQGMLLGAPYYGVVASQLLAGWICDKYGKMKSLMITGALILSLSSVLSPVILEHSGVQLFLAARILKGIGMGFLLMPILPMQIRWSTPKEHGLLVGLATSGVGIANSITYPISGLLCQHWQWKSIFYFAGITGFVWILLALFLLNDSPMTHPRVSAEEKQYLLRYSTSQSKRKKVAVPWLCIVRSIPVWSVVITNLFFFAAAKGVVVVLPIFVKDVLDFSVTENGVFSAMPLVAALILHMFVGPMFDYARAKSYCSLTALRKTFTAIGSLIPAAVLFAVSQTGAERKYLIIGLITVASALTEVTWMGGFYLSMMDIAPDFVGVLQGINRTIGFAGGFAIPMVVSALTPNGTPEEWGNVFLMFGGLYAFSCLVYFVTGSADTRSWGRVQKPPSDI